VLLRHEVRIARALVVIQKFGNSADERTGALIPLRNCLKISSGALYFAFHASAENNRSNRAAGALDTGDVVVFG
jgi:hypothetical protein